MDKLFIGYITCFKLIRGLEETYFLHAHIFGATLMKIISAAQTSMIQTEKNERVMLHRPHRVYAQYIQFTIIDCC